MASKRAVVVYESMYGNTRIVASGIADGLGGHYEVALVPVGKATGDLVAAAHLLVAGGPTHNYGMSSPSSRLSAVSAAGKEGSGLTMDPDSDGPGLGDWLNAIADGHGAAAAFDTRMEGSPLVTGRASRGISKLLKKHGYHLVTAPESFLVTKRTKLVDGESVRARSWGAALAKLAQAE